MTTLLHTPITIDPSGLVAACAWCCSPAQLADLERRFPSSVTHGICTSCSTSFDGAPTHTTYPLTITYLSGVAVTVKFESRLLRSLSVIRLAGQPVTLELGGGQ